MDINDIELQKMREFIDFAHKDGFYKHFPPCDPEVLEKMGNGEPLSEGSKIKIDKIIEEID